MQQGGQYAHVGGAGPVDAHLQRQRLLAQLNESTWQRIGADLSLQRCTRANHSIQDH